MNSKQRRQLERRIIRFMNKLTVFFHSELDAWESNEAVTKEDIIRQLRRFSEL
jgi:hypothetical protein